MTNKLNQTSEFPVVPGRKRKRERKCKTRQNNEHGSVVNRRFRSIYSTNLPSPYNHRRPDHHNVNVDRLFEATQELLNLRAGGT